MLLYIFVAVMLLVLFGLVAWGGSTIGARANRRSLGYSDE